MRQRAGSLMRAAMAVFAAALGGCTSSTQSVSPPPPVTVTICGKVESVVDVEKRGGLATWITVVDARSGSRFVFEIAPELQGAFEAALGAKPSAALRGTSVCAKGTHHEESERPLLAIASPADLTINTRAP